MKISVDRNFNSEGNLIFTITVTEPVVAPFTEIEKNILISIDSFIIEMSKTVDPNGDFYQNIQNANHKVKEQVFCKILERLKFSIENDLRPKFRPICQEIYNWIYDKQEGHVKTWLTEFDPQRTKFYFDNDIEMQNQINNQVYVDKMDEDFDDDDQEQDE